MLRTGLLRFDGRSSLSERCHKLLPELELTLLRWRRCACSPRNLPASLSPIIGLGHYLEARRQRRIGNSPQLNLDREEIQLIRGVGVEKIDGSYMLRTECLGDPDNFFGGNASCVRNDLPKMPVVGLLELVFDDHRAAVVRAQNVQ